jgi:DNA-binding response OmpR family regulator
MDKQMRILVVDDEPGICHLIEELLKLEGYQIDVCFSRYQGQQAPVIAFD